MGKNRSVSSVAGEATPSSSARAGSSSAVSDPHLSPARRPNHMPIPDAPASSRRRGRDSGVVYCDELSESEESAELSGSSSEYAPSDGEGSSEDDDSYASTNRPAVEAPPCAPFEPDHFWAGQVEDLEFDESSGDEEMVPRANPMDDWKDATRELAGRFPKALIGRQARKIFQIEEGEDDARSFLGTVCSSRKLQREGQVWTIKYEDGDSEELLLDDLMDCITPGGLRLPTRVANPWTCQGLEPIQSRREFKEIWKRVNDMIAAQARKRVAGTGSRGRKSMHTKRE